MITIRCSYCHKKMLRYHKIGHGQLIRCWKDRIKENHTRQDGNIIYCECGKAIAKDEGTSLKLKHSSIIISGRSIK